MRRKSQLLMPNLEKTILIKYKIFLVLKPIIQTLVSPSRVNTVVVVVVVVVPFIFISHFSSL